MPDEMGAEREVESNLNNGPRTPGEWLGIRRSTDQELDGVLFQAEQVRRERSRFLVPAKIGSPEDLRRLAQGARDWVDGNSLPTIGVSDWEMGEPFGVALAQPRLSFESVRRGQLRPEAVEGLQRLFGLETRLRHLRQLEGYLENSGKMDIYDILSGRTMTPSHVRAEMKDLETRVWPIRVVNAARAINGVRSRTVERGVVGTRVKDVELFFQPSVALVQEAPAAAVRSFRPGRSFVLSGAALVLGGVLAACSSSETKPPDVEVSPTVFAEATVSEESETSEPTVTVEPTVEITATTAPTETNEPTVTAEPTETTLPPTEVPPADLARENGLGGLYKEEREYVIVTIDGVEYLRDEYNQALMLKKVDGEWVDTSLEEKYGHLAPKDLDYSIEEVITTDGGKWIRFPLFWSGNYVVETVQIDQNGEKIDLSVTRVTSVTRNPSSGELVEIESIFRSQSGMVFNVQFVDNQLWSSANSLEDVISVFEDNGIILLNRESNTLRLYLETFRSRASDFLNSNPVCDLNDTSNRGRNACDNAFWLSLIRSGEVDFAEDIKTMIASGNKVRMYQGVLDFELQYDEFVTPEGVVRAGQELSTLP